MSNSRRPLIWCSCMLFLLALVLSPVGAQPASDVEALFEQRYAAWRAWLYENWRLWDDDPWPAFDNEPFREIVALGVDAVPYMMKRVKDDHMLGYALHKVTKWRSHLIREGDVPGQRLWYIEEFPDMRDEHGSPDARAVWRRWWKEAREITPKLFEKRYAEWKEAKAKGDDDETEKRYQRIKDLGVPALPSIMKKVEEGEEELLPVVSYLTDNAVNEAVKEDLDAGKCLKWWAENKEKWSIRFDKYDPERDDVARAALAGLHRWANEG